VKCLVPKMLCGMIMLNGRVVVELRKFTGCEHYVRARVYCQVHD
jgi:hypothetical protein